MEELNQLIPRAGKPYDRQQIMNKDKQIFTYMISFFYLETRWADCTNSVSIFFSTILIDIDHRLGYEWIGWRGRHDFLKNRCKKIILVGDKKNQKTSDIRVSANKLN